MLIPGCCSRGAYGVAGERQSAYLGVGSLVVDDKIVDPTETICKIVSAMISLEDKTEHQPEQSSQSLLQRIINVLELPALCIEGVIAPFQEECLGVMDDVVGSLCIPKSLSDDDSINQQPK